MPGCRLARWPSPDEQPSIGDIKMPRVIHVKAARKDNPACKKGESYYHWSFRYGGKHYSKTYPRQSQLTQSDFLSQAYSIQERIEDWDYELDANTSHEDTVADIKEQAESFLEEVVSEVEELANECEEKRDNMPEGLQEGPTGELLEGRASSCEEWASNLESVDIEECEGEGTDEDDTAEEYKEKVLDLVREHCSYEGE